MFTVFKPKGNTKVKAVRVTLETVEGLAKMFNGRLVLEKTEFDHGSEPKLESKRVLGFEYPTFDGVIKVDLGTWLILNDDSTLKIIGDKEFTDTYEPARVVTTRS